MAPPGVDTTRFHPPVGGWRADGYLLSVARLGEARKGHDRMVRAYAAVREAHGDAPPLVLAGSGRLAPAVTELVARLGLADHVEIRTNVPEEELVGLYQGAALFWVTSYEEGFGLSVVEALACGVPVVATRTTGTAATLTPDCGRLVDQAPDIAQEFVRHTLELLGDRGAAASHAARRRACETFDGARAAQPFLDAYLEAVAVGR